VIEVVELDHIVLRVADVERSLAWYIGKLGLEGVNVEAWRREEAFFPSLRITADTIIDLVPGQAATGPAGNLDHLCLVVAPGSMDEVDEAHGFEVVDEGDRSGARGIGHSTYVLDPDGNPVELRTYPTDG
jgi:catechol 2,3-dioxygenase-like lactoylglutathione lyase family enzyme